MSVLLARRALAQMNLLSESFRVVIVNGPRQSGKTTLLRQFHRERGGTLRSLDDEQFLQNALADPPSLVRDARTPIIIDEVQRAGDPLILAIKHAVDQDDSAGQFVLAGSTRFLTVPTLSESLAGRAVFVSVWPFATAERTGASTDDLVDILLDAPEELLSSSESSWERNSYINLICEGGYPEAVRIQAPSIRGQWYRGYLETVVQRDIRNFASIQHGAVIPQLLRLLAARTGSSVVASDLAKTTELAQPTVKNYLSYLDTVFLTTYVPAWSTNLTTKVARTPKVYITDSGLAAHLMDTTATMLRRPGNTPLGALVETFVANELTKLFSDNVRGVIPRYFRDRDGREIDFILETGGGRVLGIEVKSSSTVRGEDFRHLAWLRDRLGDRFTGGIVLHLGPHSLPFGDRLFALPVSALWGHAPLHRSLSQAGQ